MNVQAHVYEYDISRIHKLYIKNFTHTHTHQIYDTSQHTHYDVEYNVHI